METFLQVPIFCNMPLHTCDILVKIAFILWGYTYAKLSRRKNIDVKFILDISILSSIIMEIFRMN